MTGGFASPLHRYAQQPVTHRNQRAERPSRARHRAGSPRWEPWPDRPARGKMPRRALFRPGPPPVPCQEVRPADGVDALFVRARGAVEPALAGAGDHVWGT
ncbi:hypothetical protein GCM10027168_19460 [Streptomyces capparidis]